MRMRYLLDTDTVIYIIKRHPPKVASRFERIGPEDVGISTISIAELMFGAAKSRHQHEARRAITAIREALMVVPFDEEAARAYGGLRASLEQRGRPIGAMDTLIAAHARALGAVLVTNNVREFSRVQGLKIENWVGG